MAGLTLSAPAKLNLWLRVGRLRADGYHPIESLMVTIDAPADRVTLRVAQRRELICAVSPGADNLAWRALDALERATGVTLPLAVEIEKEIPAGAGLGGGSSDAAATLVGANRLLGLGLAPAELEAIAAEVGSDVPFFIRGGAQWAAGRGERLRPAGPIAPFAALVVMAAPPLATARVYAAFDRMGGGRGPAPREPDPTVAPASWVGNDLWPAALALAPGLGRIARELRAAGADATLLCGSGAAITGIFRDRSAARIASEGLAAGLPRWVAERSSAAV